jgi:hypothetical protein
VRWHLDHGCAAASAAHLLGVCSRGTFAGRASLGRLPGRETTGESEWGQQLPPISLGATMSTRTIAIVALAIAVALVVILFVL